MALQKYKSDVLGAENSKKDLFSLGGSNRHYPAGLKNYISLLSLGRVKEILGVDPARTADGLPHGLAYPATMPKSDKPERAPSASEYKNIIKL